MKQKTGIRKMINPEIIKVALSGRVMLRRIVEKVLFMSLLLTLFTACLELDQGIEVIVGKGPVISVEYDILAFENLYSEIIADINIHPAEDPRLVVTMEENLHAYIRARSVYDNLFFSFNGRTIKSNHRIIIDVYTPHIKKFYLSGRGVVVSDLPVEEIHVSGMGGLYFRGEAEKVLVNFSGDGGFVDLLKMPVKQADIAISGSADVFVKVEETLNVFISGVGHVGYKGKPSIHQSITGFGHIYEMN